LGIICSEFGHCQNQVRASIALIKKKFKKINFSLAIIFKDA
jgi:hypothetical protein